MFPLQENPDIKGYYPQHKEKCVFEGGRKQGNPQLEPWGRETTVWNMFLINHLQSNNRPEKGKLYIYSLFNCKIHFPFSYDIVIFSLMLLSSNQSVCLVSTGWMLSSAMNSLQLVKSAEKSASTLNTLKLFFLLALLNWYDKLISSTNCMEI